MVSLSGFLAFALMAFIAWLCFSAMMEAARAEEERRRREEEERRRNRWNWGAICTTAAVGLGAALAVAKALSSENEEHEYPKQRRNSYEGAKTIRYNKDWEQERLTLSQVSSQMNSREPIRRMYGYFKCESCGHYWESAASYKGYWQKCANDKNGWQKCGQEVFPFRQRALQRNDDERNSGRPHNVQGCQRCQVLGRKCC
jgi:hypothetical protein